MTFPKVLHLEGFSGDDLYARTLRWNIYTAAPPYSRTSVSTCMRLIKPRDWKKGICRGHCNGNVTRRSFQRWPTWEREGEDWEHEQTRWWQTMRWISTCLPTDSSVYNGNGLFRGRNTIRFCSIHTNLFSFTSSQSLLLRLNKGFLLLDSQCLKKKKHPLGVFRDGWVRLS